MGTHMGACIGIIKSDYEDKDNRHQSMFSMGFSTAFVEDRDEFSIHDPASEGRDELSMSDCHIDLTSRMSLTLTCDTINEGLHEEENDVKVLADGNDEN